MEVWYGKRRTHSRCKGSQQELRESRGTERDFFCGKAGRNFRADRPDGAGKSTLFRILTTLLLADKGTATVNGLDVVTDYKQIRTKVGYMPGRFSLYQDLSVEENLEFFATVFHTSIQENYDLIKDIYQQIEPFKKRRQVLCREV